jgi:hypothetical protein
VSTCRHCGAPVRWVTTAKRGKPMPLDPEPNPEGNVILRSTDGAAVVLDIPDRDYAVELDETVWRAHFASCPHYSERRRR